MSNPSYSNIDRWLFELMEGNLSPEQVAQLKAFLIQHPELDVDRDMWELAKVSTPEVVYPQQNKLIKRRPVGLFMSLGFASMAIMVGLGFYSFFGDFTQYMPTMDGLITENTNGQSGANSYKKSKDTSSYNEKDEITEQPQANDDLSSISDVNRTFAGITLAEAAVQQQGTMQREGNSTTLINNSYQGIGFVESEKNLEAQNSITNPVHDQKVVLLKTEKAKHVDYVKRDNSLAYRLPQAFAGKRFEKTDYKMSLSSKISRMGRQIQRMMDNPVALKNMKDPYYHVPGMQSTDINFGAVGTLLATRVQTTTRAQWYGSDNQQFMNQISLDGYSYGMRGGFGFVMNHNYYGNGEIQDYNAAMTYSPKFSVARNVVVEPSVRFKMGSKKLDAGGITDGSVVEFDRMNSHQFSINGAAPMGQTLWYKDLGLGLMVNTKWFFVGVQGDNLMQHYDNIYSYDPQNPRRVGKHFVATLGTDYESMRENFSLSPYIVYQQQEQLSEAWMGFNMKYHWVTLGGAISSNLEPAASIGLKFDHIMIAYNADYVHSEMLQKSSLSHQLTIRFLSKLSRVGQRLLNQ
jgi:type IX secretion system PorP/SprF family membrane protein